MDISTEILYKRQSNAECKNASKQRMKTHNFILVSMQEAVHVAVKMLKENTGEEWIVGRGRK